MSNNNAGQQLKKYINEISLCQWSEILLNGKKNDLWRLSFFYVILFSVFAFDTFDPFPYFLAVTRKKGKNRFCFCTIKLMYETKHQNYIFSWSIFGENIKSQIFFESCKTINHFNSENDWTRFFIINFSTDVR